MNDQSTYLDDIKKAELFLEEGLKQLKERFKTQHPRLAEQYGTNITTRVYKKRAPGSSKILPAIIDFLLSYGKTNHHLTKRAVLNAVRPQFPNHTIVDNVWYQEFVPYQKKTLEKKLRGSGKDLSLAKGCRNLSELKERLIIAFPKTKGEHILSAKILLRKESIIINGNSYTISNKESPGGYSYPCIRFTVNNKRKSIRVDDLVGLLNEEVFKQITAKEKPRYDG